MFQIGDVLEHGLVPEMGRARVERVSSDEVQLRVHRSSGGSTKIFKLPNPELRLSANQAQDGFDAPRSAPGKGKAAAPKRSIESWGFEAAMDRFGAAYPEGFSDPKYLRDERDYKQAALAAWTEGFGPEGLPALRQGPAEVAKAFNKVYAVIPMLHPAGEWIPFHKALQASPAAVGLAEAYAEVAAAGAFDEASFNRVLEAFAALGDAKPKWTVFTYWPYVATTRGFAFVKPTLVQAAAAGMGIGLNYEPKANWLTYSQAIALYKDLWRRLEPLAARDWVDVQTFLWVGWKKA